MSRHPLLLCIALALSGSPAVAQPAADTVRITQNLATCLVRTRGRIAEAYVAGGTPDARSPDYQRLLETRCLPGAGAPPLDPRLVRGAIYEELYARDFANGGPTSFADVPPLALPNGGANPPLEGALLRFGECVVRADPGDSRALLSAAFQSPGERASIEALTPHLSPCMQDGLTVTFSAPILRGVVAEALYKLSRASAAPRA